MTHLNVNQAADFLGRNLNSFAGHSIDPTHTSYAYGQLLRAASYIKHDPAASSVTFDGSFYCDGESVPVDVIFSGTDTLEPVDIIIKTRQ